MSIDYIIRNFADGKYRHRQSCNVFMDNTCTALYSYGEHFPLAVKVGDTAILNGDRYSVSTGRHQSNVRSIFSGAPTVSFSALNRAGIDLARNEIYKKNPDRILHGDEFIVIEHESDWNELYEPDGKWSSESEFLESLPHRGKIGELRRRFDDTGELEYIHYHLLGGMTFQYRYGLGTESDRENPKFKSKSYLSGNEGSYFLSQLPKKPKNIADAYDILKPPLVREIEHKHGKDGIIRQGEWFFIPIDLLEQKPTLRSKDFISQIPLPIRDSSSNLHVPSKSAILGKLRFCTGIVRHRRNQLFDISKYDPKKFNEFTAEQVKSSALTHEHRHVRLGKAIYLALENTAIVSYSSAGNID